MVPPVHVECGKVDSAKEGSAALAGRQSDSAPHFDAGRRIRSFYKANPVVSTKFRAWSLSVFALLLAGVFWSSVSRADESVEGTVPADPATALQTG